jgi:hypothetical protein
MSDQPSRRTFLKVALAAVASLFLPSVLFARRNPRSSWFLHTATGESWQVDDPVSWSLENAHQPILERARERLVTLDATDPQRVVRLVTRRCHLNLLELHPRQVVVHHWGQQGLADVRPFFKSHGLARKNVKVVVKDRKREAVTMQRGDDFLFGDRLAAEWLLKVFLRKWHRRFEQQSNDWTAAPGTWSGYAWEGVESNLIPWRAMKSAWRRTAPLLCLNCDQPTILANFGFPWTGMFNRTPMIVHVCGACRRSFVDDSVKDVGGWIVANLDAEVVPSFIMMWDKRVKWEPPIKDTIPS